MAVTLFKTFIRTSVQLSCYPTSTPSTIFAHQVIKHPNLLNKQLPLYVKLPHATFMALGTVYHSCIVAGICQFASSLESWNFSVLRLICTIPIAYYGFTALRKHAIKAARCFQMIFAGSSSSTYRDIIEKLIKFKLLESDKLKPHDECNERKWAIRFAVSEASLVAQRFIKKFPDLLFIKSFEINQQLEITSGGPWFYPFLFMLMELLKRWKIQHFLLEL